MAPPRTSLATRALGAWVELVLRRPLVTVLAFVALSTAALAYTIERFRISTDRDAMVSPELPFRQNHARYEREFPQSTGTLVLVIDAPTPERAREVALGLAEGCRERPELFDSVHLPLLDPFLERHGLLFLSRAELDALAGRLARVQPFLGRLVRDTSLRGLCALLVDALGQTAAQRALELEPVFVRLRRALAATRAGEPASFSWQELVGGDRAAAELRRQLLVLQPRLDYGALFPGEPSIDFLRARIRALGLEPEPGLHVRLTGSVALAHEELASVLRGSQRIALLVAALVLLVLLVGLRSWRLMLAIQLTLLGGLCLTGAFAFSVVEHVNLISIAFAALYLGLGADYAIQLALRFQDLVDEGLEHSRAARAALADVGLSLATCALATALGFYAFVPTAYAGVSELGLISGTGMFLSLLASVTVLPAALVLRPLRIRPRTRRPASRRMRGLARFPERRRGALRAVAALLLLVSLGTLARVRFDANPLNLRDPASESVATFRDLLASSTTPPWSMNVLCAGAQEAQRTAERLRALSSVGRVASLHSFVPGEPLAKLALLEDLALLLGFDLDARRSRATSDADERAQALRSLAGALAGHRARSGVAADPAAEELERELGRFLSRLEAAAPAEGAQLTLALEAGLLATLPASLERLALALEAQPFDLDDLPSELVLRWRSPQGSWRVEAFPADDLDQPRAMGRFVDEVRSVAPAATGGPSTILDSGDAVVQAFQQALTAALVTILLLLCAVLRNVREVVLVLAPLLLAAALTCATLVVCAIPFNFANVIGLPLLFGTNVDSSVHMVLRARSSAKHPLETSTAKGIVLSALTSFCSFASLSSSGHPGTASMGVILTIGITWMLIACLVVLPALLPAQRTAPPPS